MMRWSDEKIYIHYGSTHYDPSLFVPVRNCDWKPKPEGGLWGSREEQIHEDGWTNYGWKEWCEDNGFHRNQLKSYFRFTLSEGSKVLLLKNTRDLLPLPKIKTWRPKDRSEVLNLPEGQITTREQLDRFFQKNPCYLDYEKMVSESVDAIELQHSFLFRDCLDTWDCDCIVVLNPDAVVEVE